MLQHRLMGKMKTVTHRSRSRPLGSPLSCRCWPPSSAAPPASWLVRCWLCYCSPWARSARDRMRSRQPDRRTSRATHPHSVYYHTHAAILFMASVARQLGAAVAGRWAWGEWGGEGYCFVHSSISQRSLHWKSCQEYVRPDCAHIL